MRFVNPFSHIMSIFLRATASPPLPPAMNARPPLSLPPPRPGQGHAPVRTTCVGTSPTRTHLSPCQGHAHVPDADRPQNRPCRGQRTKPSLTGTNTQSRPRQGRTRNPVPNRDKKAPRPHHGRGKQLSDDNDLIFRCGELFDFYNSFLSRWDGYYHFDNGFLLRLDGFFDFCNDLLSRWDAHCNFATAFFRVEILTAILQQSF